MYLNFFRGKVFVSRTITPTTCCVNSSGLQPVKSQNVDTSTCSVQTCVKPESYLHAFWNVEREYYGCDCCNFNGTLVPDGWSTPINSFQNLTCCKGELQETYLPRKIPLLLNSFSNITIYSQP